MHGDRAGLARRCDIQRPVAVEILQHERSRRGCGGVAFRRCKAGIVARLQITFVRYRVLIAVRARAAGDVIAVGNPVLVAVRKADRQLVDRRIAADIAGLIRRGGRHIVYTVYQRRIDRVVGQRPGAITVDHGVVRVAAHRHRACSVRIVERSRQRRGGVIGRQRINGHNRGNRVDRYCQGGRVDRLGVLWFDLAGRDRVRAVGQIV